MRYHELIRESVLWLDDPPDLVTKYVNDWNSRPEYGDGLPEILTVADVARSQAALKKLVYGGHLMAYRGMVMRYRDVAGLHPGDGVGLCWTSDRRYALPLNVGSGSRGQDIIFTAHIPVSSVDWLATITLHLSGGEKEIRLKPDAPLTVTNIVDGYGANIREDLWGETFVARRHYV